MEICPAITSILPVLKKDQMTKLWAANSNSSETVTLNDPNPGQLALISGNSQLIKKKGIADNI